VSDIDHAEGGYVGYDCRSGDLVTWHGANWRVVDTMPNKVRLEATTSDDERDPVVLLVGYRELAEGRAFYAARLIPCLPPEGETKL